MKRTMVAILLAAVSLLVVLWIGLDKKPAEPTDMNDPDDEIINSGENFIVTELNDGKATKYQYTVADKNGNILEQAICAEEPRVVQKSEKLLGIRFSFSGSNIYRYYDLENGAISPTFKNAFWDNGTLVAYYEHKDGLNFTVQPIFGEGHVATVKADTNFWHVSVRSAVLSPDNTSLDISYVSGDEDSASAIEYHVSVPITVMPELNGGY